MIEENKESAISRLVSMLIYPGILGSMIYDVIPNGIFFDAEYLNPKYFDFGLFCIIISKLFILSYFIVDFWHLNFVMSKNYEPNHKNTFKYIFCDFLVSLILLAAFKSAMKDAELTIFFIFLIPFLFYTYGCELFQNRGQLSEELENKARERIGFYKRYIVLNIILIIIYALLYNLLDQHNYILFPIIIIIHFWYYGRFVKNQFRKIKADA